MSALHRQTSVSRGDTLHGQSPLSEGSESSGASTKKSGPASADGFEHSPNASATSTPSTPSMKVPNGAQGAVQPPQSHGVKTPTRSGSRDLSPPEQHANSGDVLGSQPEAAQGAPAAPHQPLVRARSSHLGLLTKEGDGSTYTYFSIKTATKYTIVVNSLDQFPDSDAGMAKLHDFVSHAVLAVHGKVGAFTQAKFDHLDRDDPKVHVTTEQGKFEDLSVSFKDESQHLLKGLKGGLRISGSSPLNTEELKEANRWIEEEKKKRSA